MTAVGGGPNMAAELDVHVQVTNVNEGGEVLIKWLQPEVGTPLPASLEDDDNPDGGETIYSWQWYRAKVANPNRSLDRAAILALGDPDSEWEVIDITDSGDGTMTYTPQGTRDSQSASNPRDLDEGWHLLVRVEYDDAASANEDEGNDTDNPDTPNVNEDMDRFGDRHNR